MARKQKGPRPQSSGIKSIVIPVMGPTGAGKSTFINALLRDNSMKVGNRLKSCTSDLAPTSIRFPGYFSLEPFELVIVDTPGFDDTYETDEEILRRIAEYLKDAHMDEKLLGGVIYLHDVSIDRFTGTARRNLEMFEHLCGEDALCKVFLGTTKWSVLVKPDIALSHEEELVQEYWSPLITKGSNVRRFEDSYESAKGFIDAILLNFQRENLRQIALQIQNELTVDKKILPETEAGKKLRFTLQEVKDGLERQKRVHLSNAPNGNQEAEAELKALQEKMEKVKREIKELKIPLGRRFRSFLGF